MDNSKLYEEVMLGFYFNKMKAIRNQWDNVNKSSDVIQGFDVSSDNYRMYNFVIDRSQELIYEMVGVIVSELLKRYNIEFGRYKIVRDNAHIYIVSNNKDWPEYVPQRQSFDVFAYGIGDVLYIFKEFGINNRMPKTLRGEILKQEGLKSCVHVSLVKEDAFLEVLDYNKNLSDPSRGTGAISLKIFFENLFGAEEYSVFDKYIKIFIDKVKDYFGIIIVKTLKTNVMHNYRKSVKDILLDFRIEDYDKEGRISENQRKLLNWNFFENKNYEVLIGKSDFAKSFITAEWLYSSLENSANIDQTVVAMGYFKGIEQLLFQFLKLHTYEKDKRVKREVYVGKGVEYADEKGNAKLIDDLVNDKEKVKRLTLGSLTSFFGYYSSKEKRYFERNRDLLVKGIDETTYEYIIDVFSNLVGLRNGYFHKDNLEDWGKVKKARSSALMVFYLLLGAYGFKERDKDELGLVPDKRCDDFYRLCEYMNKKAFEVEGLEVPIFYLDGETNPYGYWNVHRDDYIKYDYYDEPIYSGVYFDYRRATKENVPTEIWEGVLQKMKPSGPLRKIYDNGKFIG